MRYLAIDPGTQLGWAVLETPNGIFYHGVQDFSLKRGESGGMRFLMFEKWLNSLLDTTQSDLIVYELPHMRGGYATSLLDGLVAIIQKVCATRCIQYTSVHSATLKKFATGKGNSNKDAMVEACRKIKGCEGVMDDNESDAIHLAMYAVKRLV